MKKEQSAGIVVFRHDPQTGKYLYLLLHYLGGHWDLPKGKMEANESLEQAASREVREETGLIVEPIKGFSENISYYYRDQNRELVDKSVTFFAGETEKEEVVISPEHIGFAWLDVNNALKQLTYNNARHLLSMVNQFVHARDEAQEYRRGQSGEGD
ncbi:MAG: NUDIX domain-containing protein [Candidatus Dependentiae bacterium]|nr:NUDIX domain-containing protein [Candidatus Dependentiae bacterium]